MAILTIVRSWRRAAGRGLEGAPAAALCLSGGVLAVGLCLSAGVAAAQPVDFGSSDDPREQLQLVWWRYQNSLDVTSGLSLISDHWRGGLGVNLNLVTPSMTARLNGTIRGGLYGRYAPDSDELYDLIRLIEFARLTPAPRSNLYLRVGRLNRIRLGTGHVVNFFNSDVAWDRRTVGAEGVYSSRLMDASGFIDNLFVNGVVGGRIALRPLFFTGDARTTSLALGLNYVTDLHSPTDAGKGLTAYNVDLSFNALSSGEVRLAPFGSFAWYPDFGSGIGFGADVQADNFIDLARFRLRLALYYNGRQFIPGYVGSFYQVNSPSARILNSERYLEGNREVRYEGIELARASGGNDFETELRILIFERFELWYYFRRHYGSHSLSEYHLRLFFHQPNRLRINVGMDRGGLLGFFSLFNDLGDQTALVFGTDYRLAGPFWTFINARYSFEHVGVDEAGRDQYLVQRRFEPFTGVRFEF